MKKLKFMIVLLVLATITACNNDDDINDVSTFSESYSLKLIGELSDRVFSEDVIVEREDVINDDKVNLNSVNPNGNTLTIQINIPADRSPSGKKERIGISIRNLDATDIWNLEDGYQSFHFSLSGTQRKQAIFDYVIEGDNELFGSLNLFQKSTISLKREGALLKGTIQAVVQSAQNNQVSITGSFEANLDEDDLE